jgi:O-antigen ligase
MNIWNGDITRDRSNITFSIFSYFSFFAMAIALLLGGAVFGLLSGGLFGNLGLYVVGGLISTLVMAIFIGLRQDELAVVVVVAVHLFVDWYLALHIVGALMGLALLVVFFLARSSEHPFVEPRALWLWALYLILTIYPAIRGALTLYDASFYYPNIIFSAFVLFWLGSVIARDIASVRRFFKLSAVFGALVAMHTIIQGTTGTFLFATTHFDAFLSSVSGYDLYGTDVHRIGSFFVDPNWNGTFFALMLFIPLGLFFDSTSLLEKSLYLMEMFLILLALLLTFSIGAWIGVLAGIIAFLLLAGRASYRFQIILFIGLTATILMVYFPLQVGLLFQHASGPEEVSLRVGAWQTAIRVMIAYPLMGVGLGLTAYIQRADPFRVPAQYIPLAHPHNSYLELGAMAGPVVLIVFLALLLFALRLALRNWTAANVRARSLLAGGIAAVIALSINSISINGWTLPPLAAMGWLTLGTISSPFILKIGSSKSEKETN